MQKKYDNDWNQWILDQQASGKNIKTFCKEKGISYDNFKYHKYQGQKRKEPLTLIPLTLQPQPTLKFFLNGNELTLDADIDDQSLQRIVKALTS